MSSTHHDDRMSGMRGGLLSERLRHGNESFAAGVVEEVHERGPDVRLGSAAQIEVEDGQVRFLVLFSGQWPSEYWLRAFRQAQEGWPGHLVEPRLDEGRGLYLGPLPAPALEEHVRAAKEHVEAANRIFFEEIEPELRRQREEALRREQEQERLQAEVEAKLKSLLG